MAEVIALAAGEGLLKEATDAYCLSPGQGSTGSLCHPFLTDRRLVLCEARYDIAAKRERGVGDVLHDVWLKQVERVLQCADDVEPHFEVWWRDDEGRGGRLLVGLRDAGWHVATPQRLDEADAWAGAINERRRKLGFEPEPLKPRRKAAVAAAAADEPLSPNEIELSPAGRMSSPVSSSPPQAGAAPPAALAQPKLAAGARLGGHYEIVRQIGSGGMGIVYEGKDHSLDRLVAIKRMRPDVKLGTRDREQFLREAKTSAALHHPFICDIYAILDQRDEILLVFEYIDGESLDEFLDRERRMPADKTVAVLKQVCEALTFAHERKVAHRDLKPSNIMLSRPGYAKVMDFGIARAMKDTISRLSQVDSSGTYPYMAPEQELGRCDARSDLFALGVTAYELLAGELPFPGPNFYLQKEKGEFRPLAEAAPGTPPGLAAAVERCMRFDPAERFASVREFAAAAGAL